jgi:anaerobic magnesium-protoporphyrin IX monomethyl ester cyclase
MHSLDILFVHPNASEKIYQDLSKKASAIEPPIWAAMLANHCRTKGFNPAILDCEAERLDWQESAKLISDYKAKVICFVVYGQQPSASSQNMTGAVGIANYVKQLTNTPIVFVGGHVAALPQEVLQEDCVDIVLLNEGVYAISNLLSTDLSIEQLRNCKGIGFKDSGNIVLNEPERIVPKSMLEHDLPGMAWDLLPDFSKYRTAPWHSWSNNTEQYPFAALYTSLGCPYKCSFCMINIINRTSNLPLITSEDSNSFRWWNPEFIIKQFDFFAENNIKNIKIADELFVLNPNHFQKICNLIIERGYNFNIWAYSRVDTCKPQYLDTLKKAGVNWLGLGIENPNQLLRQEIHKDHFVDVKITDLMQNMRDAGINIGGNYIFGLPMDTKESMQSTLDFALANKTEMVNFYCAMAYPGSPLHKTARQKGWKLPETYSGYSQHSYDMLNLSNDNLSAKDIMDFRDKAFITYNSDPDYLKLLETKFGVSAKQNMEETLNIKLKRKLLGD